MTPTIYKIEFPDGSFYIGATCNFKERRRTHLRHAKKGKSVNAKLQSAFLANPTCEIKPIASGFDREEIHALESLIIEQERPTLNVNLAPTPIPSPTSGRSKNWGPYRNIREAANAIGKSYGATKKVAAKFTHEEYLLAIGRPRRDQTRMGPPDPRRLSHLIRLDSGWYARKAIAKVDPTTFRSRIRRGWGKEEALVTPMARESRPVTASAVARRYGVSPGVYYVRRHNGWTLMEALGIHPRPKQGPKKVKPRLLTANGRTMPLNKWAAEIGVPPNVIHARLHAGWTEAEAVGAEKRPAQVEKERRAAEKAARKKPKLTYTVNGFAGTLPEICVKFGYNYPAANSRRRAGYPFETWFLSVDDFWRYGLAKRAVDAGRELPLALADLPHAV